MALSAEDVLAIEQLLVRYAYIIDLESTPEDEFLKLWTEDAVIVSPARGTYRGLEGLKAFAHEQRHSRFGQERVAQLRHFITNVQVEGDGEEAKMRAYSINYATDQKTTPRTSKLLLACHYDCDVRRVNGEWRLASRVATYDHVSGTPGDKSELDHSEVPLWLVPA
jgi:hypothetical protein